MVNYPARNRKINICTHKYTDTTLCVTPISSWASRNRALNLVTHFVSGEYPGTSGSGKPASDNVAELLKFSFRIPSHWKVGISLSEEIQGAGDR